VLRRVIVTAGGTGGHIFPAIAIAEELISKGIEVLYVGNRNSMEERICQEKNLSFAPIDVQKLYRRVTLKHLLFPFKFMRSYLMSRRIIKRFQPDASIGTGGFVSGPVIFYSGINHIPVYLQEQNSYPGLTTRWGSRYARQIFLGYESAKELLPSSKCIYTGNPLQLSFIKSAIQSQHREENNDKTLLVMGGSQGAERINNAVLQAITQIIDLEINILWQTGERDYNRIKEALKDIPAAVGKVEIFPFSTNMSAIYNRTDLAITRAGALSLAELEVMNIPALIIPITRSEGNHQLHNAREQVRKNVAVLIEESELTSSVLIRNLQILRDDLNRYRERLGKKANIRATQQIIEYIIADLYDKETRNIEV